MADSSGRLCFVISPIGDEDSEIRVHADWLLEQIIEPVFAKFPGFVVERSDRLSQPGLIDAQMIRKLITAEIVVADLTSRNPNVFYEIGIRHMAGRPTIHMHYSGETIPFDLSLYRSITYARRTSTELKRARDDLRKAVAAILEPNHRVENPVTQAFGIFQLRKMERRYAFAAPSFWKPQTVHNVILKLQSNAHAGDVEMIREHFEAQFAGVAISPYDETTKSITLRVSPDDYAAVMEFLTAYDDFIEHIRLVSE